MKSFREFLSEDTNSKPGTYGHFETHVKGYLKHTDAACRIEDRPGDRRNSTPHWEKAEAHENEIKKHYGEKALNHVHNNVGENAHIGAAWDRIKKA